MTATNMRTTTSFSMNDSREDGSGDYARSGGTATTRRFRPTWLPTLAAALLVPLFIAAGQWQWNKASAKADLQQQFDALATGPAVQMPAAIAPPEALRYRNVTARGTFEPQRQILIDNRIHRQRAGFHVITPLRIEGSDVRVLVNRGWIAGSGEHDRVPEIDTPAGAVEVSGQAVVPTSRFFTLGEERSDDTWQRVWQNLDMKRYARVAGFPIQPVVVQMSPDSTAGGFAREWPRPDDRRLTNLGYALQWWSFAATTVALWLYFGFRRKS